MGNNNFSQVNMLDESTLQNWLRKNIDSIFTELLADKISKIFKATKNGGITLIKQIEENDPPENDYLPAYNWKSQKEIANGLLNDLRLALIEKNFIAEITASEFKQVFTKKTKARIDFIGMGAMINMLYFNVKLWHEYEKVHIEKDCQKRLLNCYLNDGEKLKIGSVSAMLPGLRKHFNSNGLKAKKSKRKLEMDQIFKEIFGPSPKKLKSY